MECDAEIVRYDVARVLRAKTIVKRFLIGIARSKAPNQNAFELATLPILRFLFVCVAWQADYPTNKLWLSSVLYKWTRVVCVVLAAREPLTLARGLAA